MTDWITEFKALDKVYKEKIDFTEKNYELDDIFNETWNNFQQLIGEGFPLFIEGYQISQGDATDKQVEKLMLTYNIDDEDDLFDEMTSMLYIQYRRDLKRNFELPIPIVNNVHAEIEYTDKDGDNIYCDISPPNGSSGNFDDGDYRKFLHDSLDEWLNESSGTGQFYLKQEGYEYKN